MNSKLHCIDLTTIMCNHRNLSETPRNHPQTHPTSVFIITTRNMSNLKQKVSSYLQVGNALVCIAVYTNYSMRTVTNIYIVNLAIADFLVILVCLPPSVLWDVTNTWFFGNTLCKFITYFQVSFFTYFNVFS